MSQARRSRPDVTLREPREEDMLVLQRLHDPDVTGEWDTFDDPAASMLNGRKYDGGGRTIVDGTAILGSVSYIRRPYGPNERSLCFTIGVVVLPEFRRCGVGSRAQSLLAEELFATSFANRIEADTDVENIAEQRALERAGFTREGIVRGAQWRRGEWRDLVLYARLRHDQ